MQACIVVNPTIVGLEHVGAIVGKCEFESTDDPNDPYGYRMSNNFYLGDVDLCGADGIDIISHSGAMRGMNFGKIIPPGLGDSSSEYEFTNIIYYDNGLQFENEYIMGYLSLSDTGFVADMDMSNEELLTWYCEPANGFNDQITSVKLEGRTLYRDGTWNTICLPFPIDSFKGTVFEGATAMTLYNSDFDPETGKLTLNFDKEIDGLAAGTPFFVKWNDTNEYNITDPVFENVEIETCFPYDPIGNVTDPVSFYGLFNTLEFDEENQDILYLGAENKLYYPSPGEGEGETVTIGAFRGYFELHLSEGQQAKSIQLNFGEEETGIEAVHDSRFMVQNPAWHTLDGRRLSSSPSAPGLYISNGRKIMVK